MISFPSCAFIFNSYNRKLGHSVTEILHYRITLPRAFAKCPWRYLGGHITKTETLYLTIGLLPCRFSSGSQLLARTQNKHIEAFHFYLKPSIFPVLFSQYHKLNCSRVSTAQIEVSSFEYSTKVRTLRSQNLSRSLTLSSHNF